MQRQPLGDDTVHIGGPDFVANAGRIEVGGPEQGPIGTMSMGGGGWAADPIPFPGSPSVGDVNVFPIIYEPETSAIYPGNHPDRWKGNQG